MGNIARKLRRLQQRQQAKELRRAGFSAQHGSSQSLTEHDGASSGSGDHAGTIESGRDHPTAFAEVQGVPVGKPLARMAKTADMALMFGVHPKTIERWRRVDGLPCIRVRGTVRYDVAEVIDWVRRLNEESPS